MAENSKTVISVGENIKVEDEKSIKNGDLHVPEAASHAHLENGDIKKIPEEVEPSETEGKNSTESESTNVAENKDETLLDVAVRQVIDETIKEEVELCEMPTNKENESKIIEEAEEGDNEITRSFEVVPINETSTESKESKLDEIITLQEVTIIPLKEDQTQPPSKPQLRTQLVSWDIRKTIFMFFFIFAFIVWIIAYYAYDTGLIPNDKK